MKTALADSRVRRIAVLAGVNLMLVAGGWLALVSPQRHHAALTAKQVQSVQTQLQQIAAATTPVAPKQPVIHTAPLYVLDHAMPITEDQPDLLLAVDQVAGSAHVKVTALSPSTPSQAVGYTVLPLSVSLVGSYAEITNFLRQLRSLVSVRDGTLQASGRLLSVTNVTIAPGQTATGTTGKSLTATLSIDAYVFGTVAGATPLPQVAASTDTTATSTTSTTTTSG